MRIAMWSGPRNLSTAMMYAFAQRDDFAVWDEPFYAAYLHATGIIHPMQDEILAAGERDPNLVITKCLGPVPDGKSHFYQKHMTHHMIPDFDRSWIAKVTNVFLIRHPARVIASYAAKRDELTLDDIGFRQQLDLYRQVKSMGQNPIVIDSVDIRANPEQTLNRLCKCLNIPFDDKMLRWPAGGNPADGAWAPHWYGAVHRSTGFADPEGPLPDISDEHRQICADAFENYEELRQHVI